MEKSLYSNNYRQLFPVESGVIFRLAFGTWEYRVTLMFEGVRCGNKWTTNISPLTNAHLRKNSWGFHRSSYWQNIQLLCGFVWLDGKRENKTEKKYFWGCCYSRPITLHSYFIQPEVWLQRSKKRFSFTASNHELTTLGSICFIGIASR